MVYLNIIVLISCFYIQTNTFQGILATDFERSFAVFTYKCGDLDYSGGAIIGFSDSRFYYGMHVASERGNAKAIACLNYPENVWVNVVYELTFGKSTNIVS